MADKKQEKKETAQEPKKETVYETKYNVAELAEAAQAAFKAEKVIVISALQKGGKEEYTMAEAQALVKTFINKEVKN